MLNRPHVTVYRSQSFDNNKLKKINNNNNNNNNGYNSIDRSQVNRKKSITSKGDDASSIDNDDSDSDWNSVNNDENNNNNNRPKVDNVNGKKSNIIWLSSKKAPALIIFSPEVVLKTVNECKKIGDQFHLSYKFQGGEKKLIKAILDGHGFKEVHPHSAEFNVLWTGNNLKTYVFRTLKEYQKVNHFPRSCELTRKDRLYKNVQKMQQEKGVKVSQIVPVTFVMPYEIDEFYSTFYKEKGVWIVKPVALSRGRGIYLINHPDQVPLDDNLVVSKYITNPLLIEGFKFDLRLYVAVTSFDPLVIYLYEEGLTRFATCKYDKSLKNMKNTWMHLTNYSVNKKNKKYVRCDDPDVEDYGNKWSMSAMLRYLAREGKDTFGMMMQIEELIIKTILAVESPLASAARMFIPHRGNCFEVFGFDILIDEDLKPWVLEVNLSPSLDCDAVLDLRIKSHMISDLFTITGVHCQDPAIYSNRSRFVQKTDSRPQSMRSRPHSANLLTSTLGNVDTNPQLRPQLDPRPSTSKTRASSLARTKSEYSNFEGLSQNEASIFKSVQEEHNRRGGWVRLFPTSDTWEFFSQYLEVRTTSYNLMLHQKLFPKRWLHGGSKRTSISRAKILQSSYTIYKQTSNQNLLHSDTGASLDDAIKRYKLYERKLGENINSNAFEVALKRFASETNLKNNQADNASITTNTTTGDSDIDASTSKPPIANPSSSSVTSVKVSNKNDTCALDGSKKKAFTVYRSIDGTKNSEYDLDTIIKHLDEGYYMSRAQVRYAFTLYLSKIQLRLVIESEVKDESNIQQMELVLRFMKKAARNLSQLFKVYVPSKRLPIYEQKRMLAKELQDFLHIYRKDTEQLKIDPNYDIEAQKTNKYNKSFNEFLLNNFLNKCSEMQLEEIMSAYMKNSKDSSAFLGTSNGSANNTPQNKSKSRLDSDRVNQNDSQDSIKKLNKKPLSQETPKPYNKIVTSVAISKSNKQKSNDDDNSSICSSNSSIASAEEANNKQNGNLKPKNNIKSDNMRAKSAQVEKKTNGISPITKEKLTDVKSDDTEKIFTKNDSYKNNLTNSAATMTMNLLNRPLSSVASQYKKPKSATGPRRAPLYTNDNQTKPDSTSNLTKRPFSAAVYVQKHKMTPDIYSNKETNNDYDDDDGNDASSNCEDPSNNDNNWSARLRNLTQKQQERQYSASLKKSVLQNTIIDLNKENINTKPVDDQPPNASSTATADNDDNDDQILIKQNLIIKKQKEILEQSKKALQLNKSNKNLFDDINTQVSIDETNRLKFKQSKVLDTLERYSPIDLLARQSPFVTSTKPPPAPITTTTLLTNSYKFK